MYQLMNRLEGKHNGYANHNSRDCHSLIRRRCKRHFASAELHARAHGNCRLRHFHCGIDPLLIQAEELGKAGITHISHCLIKQRLKLTGPDYQTTSRSGNRQEDSSILVVSNSS